MNLKLISTILVWTFVTGLSTESQATEVPVEAGGNDTATLAEARSVLFDQTDEPLAVTLTAPWATIARDKSPDPATHEGMLELADGTKLTADVRPRGKSRRKKAYCKFPPILLDLKRGELTDTLFAGQNKLKLVTHCGKMGTKSGKYADQLHSEYLLYRVFNRLTDASFRVRLLDINWVDSESGKQFQHPGFLIEHKKNLAKRLGATVERREKIARARLEPNHSALTALFAFFAGNSDFSFILGSQGDDCCHNTVPVRRGTADSIFAIPYDFDSTGFVDPGYAIPAPDTGVTQVSQRVHRGYCEHSDAIPEAIDVFRSAQGDINQLLSDYGGISEQRRQKLLRYVQAFYGLIDDPGKVQRRLVNRCR